MALVKKIAIDLGTSHCLVWAEGEGVVLKEPSVVAVSVEDRRVLAIGDDAKDMIGKTPEYIEVIRPLKDGVIADYEVTEAMIKYFLRKVMGRAWFFRPEVIVAVPAGVTQVEKRAVVEATISAGAKRAYLIDAPLAAAIGAKIPVSESFGNMIVATGAGATEAVVICLGGVVTYKSKRIGGDNLDDDIENYVRKKHSLIIGQNMAEEIKNKIGAAIRLKREKEMEISGRDSVTGLPKTTTISSGEIYEAMEESILAMINVIRETLAVTGPELVADVSDKGIVLTGGGAKLTGFDERVKREIGVAVHIAPEPELCVIKGAGIAIENIEVYRRALK